MMIYAIQGPAGTPIKVGFTQTEITLRARLRSLQTGYPYQLAVIATMPGDMRDERRIHDALKQFRTQGEWFEDCDAVWGAISAARDAAAVRPALAVVRSAPLPLGDQIWRQKQVCEFLGVSKPTLWRYVKAGKFPKGTRYGDMTGWRRSVVERWVDAQAKRAA
jgi:prophage regulatory protein